MHYRARQGRRAADAPPAPASAFAKCTIRYGKAAAQRTPRNPAAVFAKCIKTPRGAGSRVT